MNGTYKLLTAPTSEPISTAEAKAHLRVDIADDDTLIDSLVTAARDYVERATRRALISQTWQLFLDGWPGDGIFVLPRPPLQSISHIKYYDTAGSAATWSSTNYFVDTISEPGRIFLAYNGTYPTTQLRPNNGVEVQFIAGYGAANTVPQIYKQAILLLVGHWYENRETIVTGGGMPKEIPLAVESLLLVDRNW